MREASLNMSQKREELSKSAPFRQRHRCARTSVPARSVPSRSKAGGSRRDCTVATVRIANVATSCKGRRSGAARRVRERAHTQRKHTILSTHA
jgi:hypothetical protein